jgi:hypothetical protein
MVAHKSGIQTRNSVLADFGNHPSDFTFFEKNWDLSPSVSLTKRMEIYKINRAFDLKEQGACFGARGSSFPGRILGQK